MRFAYYRYQMKVSFNGCNCAYRCSPQKSMLFALSVIHDNNNNSENNITASVASVLNSRTKYQIFLSRPLHWLHFEKKSKIIHCFAFCYGHWRSPLSMMCGTSHSQYSNIFIKHSVFQLFLLYANGLLNAEPVEFCNITIQNT